jgi:tetratricopeptide (TPR) repeat protein
MAWAYALKGAYAQAIAEYDKIPEQAKVVAAENQLIANGLGWVYAVSGRRTDALKIAKELKDLSSHAYVDFYQVAAIYAGLGDKDEAFRLLEKGYEQHSATIVLRKNSVHPRKMMEMLSLSSFVSFPVDSRNPGASLARSSIFCLSTSLFSQPLGFVEC